MRSQGTCSRQDGTRFRPRNPAVPGRIQMGRPPWQRPWSLSEILRHTPSWFFSHKEGTKHWLWPNNTCYGKIMTQKCGFFNPKGAGQLDKIVIN